MKKFLGILVLGLMLASCSETNNDKKKVEMIEICADYQWNLKTGAYIFARDVELKFKLDSDRYSSFFTKCETLFEKNPITFKEKYLTPYK